MLPNAGCLPAKFLIYYPETIFISLNS
jgi:hypothetical protein